jgi:osmotically-inducible protein OsmY
MVHLLPRNLGAMVRAAVLREIDSDPAAHQSEVGVAAEDGLVTLTGSVCSCGMKVAVERAAKRIPGVRIVANDLHVTTRREERDTDIAREALRRLRNNSAVPATVQAVVSDGLITLDGTVRGMHQRLAAECAVKCIHGVKGVANDITLKVPRRSPVETPPEGRATWHA